jgi:hypothetical protein
MTRTPFLRAAALALGLVAAGCVGTLEPVDNGGGGGGGGGPDGGGGGGGVARQMFDSTVSPMLGSACAGCHTGTAGTAPLKFLGNTGTAGYYTAITQQLGVVGNYVPANAQLLNQGVHDNGLGPAWTTAQKDTITSWLLAEADERGL